MNKTHIKPCPFCGSKRVEVFSQDEDDCPNQSAIVRCFDCDAQSAQMVGENKIQMAINAWNKRPVEQAQDLQAKCAALAAENAGLKRVPATDSETMLLALDAFNTHGSTRPDVGLQQAINVVMQRRETPATDAYLAEVRAQARNEGINYAAGRLAAAFNHGFVDKPLAEVYDVVRMILDTKEELSKSTLPAADGLSGEYAEAALKAWDEQLREATEKESAGAND
ncbi:TPA: Lar family restriction alleviation protein [Salmonella enterica subsp. enterica serovar Saintpaul str. CFSAN004147]|nr:Lar family restriction alleviation protein [Salmonella enterica subsp. enterica serovar Saintpaul str. CFSAN004147]HCZ5289068.1 Lar family restriction alleviation protein [Salmonella enterica subsp. enterica serovar Saintpaul str. CFSAN004154]